MLGAFVFWASIFNLMVGSAPVSGSDARSVEVPIGEAGQVQVAEIVSRLATATGIAFDRAAADLTLSTQGLARIDQVAALGDPGTGSRD